MCAICVCVCVCVCVTEGNTHLHPAQIARILPWILASVKSVADIDRLCSRLCKESQCSNVKSASNVNESKVKSVQEYARRVNAQM